MGLLGTGAILMWSKARGRIFHNHWHSHEHLVERISIPGFLRGRRCVAPESAAVDHFILYELADVGVTVSAPYLERLNNPTPWTRRVMLKESQYLSRTLCRVAASRGIGVGAHVLTVRLAPTDAGGGALWDWLVGEALAEISQMPGMTGAHLLQRAEEIDRPTTEEERGRGRSDDMADWIVMAEGYDPLVVGRLADGPLSPSSLRSHGAKEGAAVELFGLAHLIVKPDVAGCMHQETPAVGSGVRPQ